MPTEVVMPQMGESIAEGTIIKWHKKAGDAVERDEPLFEITTDKVDTEVPSPVTGTLREILVNEDETVAVGTVVAIVAAAGALEDTQEDVEAPPSEPAPAAPAKEAAGHFKSSHEPTLFERKAPSQPAASSGPRTEPDVEPPASGKRNTVLSPVVAALAAKHQIPTDELVAIPGSGRGGRVTKKDVLQYVESRTSRSAPPPAGAAPPSSPTTPTPSTPAPASAPPPPPDALVYQPQPDDELVPMSAVSQQIANNMVWGQQVAAQVTSFTECDMHRIERYRDEHGADFETSSGIPLTFMPFVAEAAVRAVKEFPIFGSSVVGDRIAMKKRVHLGVAIAMERGIVTPVVRHADEMNFTGLARAIHSLSEKAHRSGLEPAEVQGATFTITSPGMFGGLTGTPLIPQPQVAILGVGAVSKKPVVVDDAIAIRPVLVLALSFDHRIIDGATAFQFLERIRIHLEQADPPVA